MNIGFIGLGKMGSGMAKNIINNGYSVQVYDINSVAMNEISKNGGEIAVNPQELARNSDIIFISLPRSENIESLFFEENGLIDCLSNETIVINLSTIGPESARYFHDKVQEVGSKYLECPVGGDPELAAKGKLPIYVGGETETYESCLPILQCISDKLIYFDDVEQSASFKLISNFMGFSNLAILAEGLRLGEKAGINKDELLSLLSETGGNSQQLKKRGPWILEEDFVARFTIDLTVKDMALAIEMAKIYDEELIVGKSALQQYQLAQKKGFGKEDSASIYKV